ncbi:MAG: fumarylacetoacetate hydrolase family protein [Anaerolineae bacterium]
MEIDRAICRFERGGQVCLGLILGGQVYDLTAADAERYGSLAGWLQAAAGREKAAIDAVLAAPERLTSVGAVDDLLPGRAGLRLCKPIDAQEVWAFGVTYEMSREARMRESEEPTIYGRVYEAERPEVFFKATAHRVVGPGDAVAIRGDSHWDVPEPELAFVVTPAFGIVGYTIGNDMSSRDIEGQNPLYLPQAKVYDRCCALGPVIRLATGFNPLELGVTCTIERAGEAVFRGATRTSRLHRSLEEMAAYLRRCNSVPAGAFVLTGTGIVPPDTFTLAPGDTVRIGIEGLGELVNPVTRLAV